MDKNIAALLREDARTVHVRILSEPSEIAQAAGPLSASEKRLRAQLNYGCVEVIAEDFPSQPPVSAKPYTYVTHLDLQVEDYVVVPAAGQLKLARVARIDDGVKIEPNSSVAYAWVVCRVDMADYQANLERNKEITSAVAEAYKVNMRRSFRQQILSGVEGPEADRLQALLTNSVKG